MHTVAVIGAGKIGEVLLSGLLRSGWSADRLLATARRPERAEELAARYGIRVVDNDDAMAADVLAIAVKPQDAAALLADLGPKVPAGQPRGAPCAGPPPPYFAQGLAGRTPGLRGVAQTPPAGGPPRGGSCARAVA